MAFRKGFKEAKPILLEPIYELEVIVPDEHMGDIMGDIPAGAGKLWEWNRKGQIKRSRRKFP